MGVSSKIIKGWLGSVREGMGLPVNEDERWRMIFGEGGNLKFSERKKNRSGRRRICRKE